MRTTARTHRTHGARRAGVVLAGLATIATGLVVATATAPADAATTKKSCTVSSTGAVTVLGGARGTLTQPIVRTDGATITGTPGNDVIYVTGDKVRVDAGAGNDVVCVTGTGDVVDGNEGDDLLVSDATGPGTRLVGNYGADTFVASRGGGTIRTSFESPLLPRPALDYSRDDRTDNVVIAPAVLDRRLRVAGNFFAPTGDVLTLARLHDGVRMARSEKDQVRSIDVPGKGTLAIDIRVTRIIGSNHDDDLVADDLRYVDAGKGDDVVRAAESDVINGNSRTLIGGTGADTLTYDRLRIEGDLGLGRVLWFTSPASSITVTDTISGFYRLVGSRYSDVLRGSSGTNVLEGRDGDDFLRGGAGDDRIYGGAGIDKLYGEEGRDLLNGGSGRDRCDGGPDKDRKISC